MGRNTTGPPWSVGRPTDRVPGAAGSVTDDKRQTTDASEQNNTGPLSPVHTSNNIEATLSIATSRTILSTKSNVALTLLLVWTGL